MERIYPHNLDVEKSILGSILLFPDKIVLLNQRVFVDSFFDERNKKIYEAICNVYEKYENLDYSLVLNYLQENNYLEHAGGRKYLDFLINSLPLVGNLEIEINILLDLAFKRSIMDICSEIVQKGFEPNMTGNEYIDYAEAKIFEISKKRRSSDFIKFSQVSKDFLEKLEISKNSDAKLVGLHTGFNTFNDFTLGLQPEQMIILAARPSVGKSAFAINLAMNILDFNKGSTVAFFSLEMSNEQIAARIYSSTADIPLTKINTGHMSSPDFTKLKAFVNTKSNAKLFFNDSSSTNIGEIRSKCRSLKQKEGLSCVVIDYLQLITADGIKSNSRQEEVSLISRSLKQMARELGIPVIALSQLSRDVEKSNNKLPMLSHLRESGSIEQDADIVLFLHREDYYNKDEENNNLAKLIIAKNRQGISGVTINLMFQKEMVRFLEISNQEENNTKVIKE